MNVDGDRGHSAPNFPDPTNGHRGSASDLGFFTAKGHPIRGGDYCGANEIDPLPVFYEGDAGDWIQKKGDLSEARPMQEGVIGAQLGTL